ncbi:MAG: alpha/beta fold hydrolase [Anaerolineaceae bacterium]|nr:alpha/beta fold hydrolase [Anaerolineaceae bacterium]
MTPSVSTQTDSIGGAHAQKRGCLFYAKRALKWFGIVLVTLLLLGVIYQAAAVELDKRAYSPRGQLYMVNGHQMHLVCMGEGSPAVILQAGGAAESLWWYRVQNQLAAHTQVCAYDRPGYGWSEPVSGSHDALTITSELHTLLAQAGIQSPYVMAGHSWGAVLTRIYASQYPDDVMGIVLVDSAILIPDHFDSQSDFDTWLGQSAGLHTLFDVLTRLGLTRLLDPGQFQRAGYPADIAAEITALHARNQVVDSDFAEFQTNYWAILKAATAAETLGSLPMAVLWASESWTGTDSMIVEAPAIRANISTFSSNSVTRVIEGADHGSILGSEQYAQQVTDAVLEVIQAVQTGEPLEN